MNDPLNQLPTDPEWVRKADEINEAAAKQLGCMVLTIAIQEDGKLGISGAGLPTSGPLHELVQDIPRLLRTLAAAVELQEAIAATRPKH